MTTSIFSDSWINIIFSGRNRDYGAYDLRKKSARNVLFALLITVGVIAVTGATTVIMGIIKGVEAELTKEITYDATELAEPPPIDPLEPPPPPPPPPPPLKTTVKFTPPQIVKDEEIAEDEPPPAAELLENVEAGTETREGDTAGVDLSLVDTGNDLVGEVSDEVFTMVEQMPEFPGGEKALLKYLSNISYPNIAKENDIEGSVYVRFVIDKAGNVTNVEVAKGADKILNEAAVEHIKKMPPWKAGKQNGKEVRVQYIVPIKFRLD